MQMAVSQCGRLTMGLNGFHTKTHFDYSKKITLNCTELETHAQRVHFNDDQSSLPAAAQISFVANKEICL